MTHKCIIRNNLVVEIKRPRSIVIDSDCTWRSSYSEPSFTVCMSGGHGFTSSIKTFLAVSRGFTESTKAFQRYLSMNVSRVKMVEMRQGCDLFGLEWLERW